MRVVIAGGGTGGHIFPAISIAEEIQRRDPKSEILFIGTERGLERNRIMMSGYKIEFISSGGIVGKGLINSLVGAIHALKGVFDSIRILLRFKPSMVVGVGGYVSGPVVLASFVLRKPAVICEQNSIPGLTNRMLARLVKMVFATFDESMKYFPKFKTRVLGNPIRNLRVSSNSAGVFRNGINVLVFGGSQGARRFNENIPRAFGILGRKDIFVIHQTGDKEGLDVRSAYERNGVMAEVLQFIEDMAGVYNRADLVIGRAGAGTIAEITALGKAAILIPYPFAAHNHQLENAKVMERAGAAVVIEDGEASPDRLAKVLGDLLKGDKLILMRENSKKLGKPNASRDIVDEIFKIAGVE